ncbi:MAG: hypothetical protein V3T83_21385 [Acidobacteriota bacterium]
MKNSNNRDLILDIFISAAEAQLRALRRLKAGGPPKAPGRKRRSNLDLVEDILKRAGAPLHINRIIEQVEAAHQVRLDRESIVSSLSKKVHRNDRFVRTGKNTFGLIGGSPS